MADLLLEILSEEIPARMQQRAAQDLRDLIVKALAEQGIAPGASGHDATPRRLIVTVAGLPARQEDLEEERKGPRVGAPDKAVEGFARSAGVEVAALEQRDTDKGPCWFAVVRREGRAMGDLLAELLPAAMAALPWPKSMRWGDHDVRWVRPIVSILALLDRAVVPFSFGPVASGDSTCGHRFLAPARFAVAGFDDYRAKLLDAHVVIEAAERRRRIAEGVAGLAGAEGLVAEEAPALLDEIAGLVEWPVPMIGGFDPAFMAVPAEVLVTEMTRHQRYVPLRDARGALAPRFVFVANGTGADGGAVIVSGNERVLAARLSDGRHFWDQDRRRMLASRVVDLDRVVFHAKLGTLGEKAARMERLAGHLAASIPGCDPDLARRAARLAKADLTSEMVGEFPELQGVMGAYYARHDGEPDAVAAAVGDHYRPQGPSDDCPTAPVSVAVALADKLDTLTGFFLIDGKPTGSRDPFALRRAALGVIRLVRENGLRLPLGGFVRVAYESYEQKVRQGVLPGQFVEHGDVVETREGDVLVRRRPGRLETTVFPALGDMAADLLAFFADRLKVHLRVEGVRHDLVDAVFARGDDDLVRLLARVAALQAFLATEDGTNLLAAYRRAANIVRIEEKKDGVGYGSDFDPAALVADEEKAVAAALAGADAAAGPALEAERFEEAMTALAALRRPVDAFFDHVTVNAEDAALRINRLKLLAAIRATLDRVADFSRIEG